jgi:hypothetical protein
MDFVGPLPLDQGHDCILTITDRLGSDIRIIPTSTTLTAKDLATLFFDKWYCENGLPNDIVSDRDKLFMSAFWKHLTLLTGIKCKASSSFHPQTKDASERTNKTVIQCLRFHVERNQKGWVRALPRIRFYIMSTVNKSTGYAPFHLRFGRSPQILPPLFPSPPNPSINNISAREIVENLQTDVADARDNLLLAKISQSHFASPKRNDEPTYKIGDKIMLSTLHHRKEYKLKGQHHRKRSSFDVEFGDVACDGDTTCICAGMVVNKSVYYFRKTVILLRPYTKQNGDKIETWSGARSPSLPFMTYCSV